MNRNAHHAEYLSTRNACGESVYQIGAYNTMNCVGRKSVLLPYSFTAEFGGDRSEIGENDGEIGMSSRR